jgi:FemAB-related protein (PEP-CTERM system-associated)
VYGGVVAKNQHASDLLYDAVLNLAKKLNVDHIELRNRDKRNSDWPGKDLYVTFRKSIDPDPDVNMNAIPRKQRAMVRKGIQAGLVSEIDENIDRFFEIYALSVRNHGTPVFAKRYLRLLKEEFGDACEVSVVVKEARPISSVISFYFRDEVLPYYGGGTLEARQWKGFDFMYWDVMFRACQNGYRIFDYGRSKQGTGSYSFKKNWGFKPIPLQYEYGLIKSNQVPDVNPLNPKYQLFINTWKRLPVSLTKLIGPPISRNLG